MDNRDLFWHLFQQTGNIGAYLIGKELEKEEQEQDDALSFDRGIHHTGTRL